MDKQREINKNLSNLPKGWVWTKLGEICFNPQYGWTTSAERKGKLRILRTTDITSGGINWSTIPFCKKLPSEKEKYLLKDGDIVISRAGSVGYSCLIRNPIEAIFASYLIRFRPLIYEKYLTFFLKSPLYWKSISEESLGIAIPNVNATKLKQISIPISPLLEQHRIVTKIEELFTKLDAGVKLLKKVKKQLKLHRQAVLKHAFEGKLTEEWRKVHKDELEPASVLLDRIKEERKNSTKREKAKYKELPPMEVPRLPKLPEGWVGTRLGNITKIILGQSPPSSTYNENKNGLPFYQGKLNFNDVFPTPRKWCIAPKKIAENGDVLICVRAPVGPTNICQEKSCIGRGLAAIRSICGMKSFFIFYLLRAFEKEISGKGTGTTFNAITGDQLKRIFVPLAPLQEQHKIVEEIERRFSTADEVEKIAEQSLKQAEKLRQSILKRAFEGKLVPQDPNDELASILLEKIEKEKARIEAEKKAKKVNKKKKTKVDPKQGRLL